MYLRNILVYNLLYCENILKRPNTIKERYMKKIITFVKDRTITGFIILIPIIVIAIVLTDTIKKLIVTTAPLTKNMTAGGSLFKAIIAILVVVFILILFFFIGGLIFKTYLGKSFKNWLENKVLANIPFYKTIRSAIQQFTDTDKTNYPVVEVDLYGNNNKLLGVITETLSDGRSVIYFPFAPLMNIGQIHIVAKENIKILDISFTELADVISKIGFESNKVYHKK